MKKVCAVLLSCMIVLLSCSIFVPEGHSGAQGSGWIPDSQVVSAYPTDINYLSPTLGADSAGRLHAVCREYMPFNGQWLLTRSVSMDGGKTWSNTGSSGFSGDVQDLCTVVAASGNNQILTVFEVSGMGIGVETQMMYDSGYSSWGRMLVESAHVHNPQLALDNTYPIYAYLVYENDSSGILGDSDIYFMRSTDYANNWTTWEEPYALAGASDTVTYTRPTIAYGSNGNLYVAFERKSGGTSEIYVMQNTGYGNRVNWGYTPGTLLSPSTGLNKHRPRMAASHTVPGTVVVTWEEEYSPTDYDIGYAYSTNTGSTWTAEPSGLYLARTFIDERNPAITVDDSGTFHFAYWSGADLGGRTNAIFYSQADWTTPGTWTSAEQVIDDNGYAYELYSQPAITAQERGGTFYPVIAWTDLRTSPPDVYCTTRGATYTILSEPSSDGGLPTVEVDSVNYTTPASFIWAAGLSHTIGAPSPQVGAGFRYLFTGWSDTGSQFHQIVAGTSDVTIAATFVIQYELVVSTDPGGLNPQPDISPAGPWYYTDTVVNITAQRVIGSYSLDHWTVDGTDYPPALVTSVVMNQPHNVIAKYGLDTTAPSISDLVQDPAGPEIPPSQTVNIQVTVTDSETEVKNVTLQYRTGTDNTTWSDWTTNSMGKTGVDTYSSSIAGYSAGTFVQYKISAFDNAENSRTLPAMLYFDYLVVPEFSPSALLTILFAATLFAALVLGRKRMA